MRPAEDQVLSIWRPERTGLDEVRIVGARKGSQFPACAIVPSQNPPQRIKNLTEGDNFDHIAFAVKNIKATVDELKGKGVTVAMEPFSLGESSSRIAFIKDPDGNWLELIEGAQSSN